MDVLARGPLEALVDDRQRLRATIKFDKAFCQTPHAQERVVVVGAELGFLNR